MNFPLRAVVRALGAALCLGFILCFFSETMFWGRPNRAPWLELTLTWLAYSVLSAALLQILVSFDARRWPQLFLCGAVYGWLVEGVLAGTLYDAFPLQISWTGLAWHDLIGVCAGWLGLSAALQRGFWLAFGVAAGLGVFWGAWATTWWQPGEGGVVTPWPAFALHAALQGLLLCVAWAWFARLMQPQTFAARRGQIGLGCLMGAWFVVVIVSARPLALLVAPPLFALTLAALRRSRTSGPTPIEVPAFWLQSPRPARLLALLAMPACATVVYTLLLNVGQLWPFNQIVFWTLTPLGFLAYFASLGAAWKSRAR